MPYKKILKLSVALIATLFFHLWLKTILPYPFFTLNIFCAVAIFTLIVNSDFELMWFISIFAVLEQAFLSTVLIINLLPLLISFGFLRWLTLNVFVNKSIAITAFLSLLFFLTYRTLFIMLTAFSAYLFSTSLADYGLIFNRCLLEMLLTSTLVVIAHFIGKLFIRNLHPEFVTMKKNIYGF